MYTCSSISALSINSSFQHDCKKKNLEFFALGKRLIFHFLLCQLKIFFCFFSGLGFWHEFASFWEWIDSKYFWAGSSNAFLIRDAVLTSIQAWKGMTTTTCITWGFHQTYCLTKKIGYFSLIFNFFFFPLISLLFALFFFPFSFLFF